MKPRLHYFYTLKAALKNSFSGEESRKIAEHAVEFDMRLIFKPWAHFRLLGANILASVFLAVAVFSKNLRYLGWAVHGVQDAVSHGNILPWKHKEVPGIDDIQPGSEKEKAIIEKTERILKKYKSKLKHKF